MRRTIVTIVTLGCLLLLGGAMPVSGQNVGGGLSFWVPESLYLQRGGSVGVESAVGSSVGLGRILSLPFGVAYDKVYGLLPEGEAAGADPSPWFVADSLLGFAMLKARVPVGPLYFDLFGGGAAMWNVALLPLTKNIEQDLAAAGQLLTFAGDPVVDGGTLGWGWQAGGGIGVKVGPASVDLNATWRVLRAAASVGGTCYTIDDDGTVLAGPLQYGPRDVMIRFAGLSIGVDVSIEM